MTKMFAHTGEFHTWRGWFLASITIPVLLGMALSEGSFHVFASNPVLPKNALVTVNANNPLSTLTNLSEGINTAVWDNNMLDSAALSAVKNAGIKTVRYPGGSTSDNYSWQSNIRTDGKVSPGDNFDAFMSGLHSINAQPVITVNYGSGTPQQAADWVHYANKGGARYTGPVPTYVGGSRTGHTYGVQYWEVGNEIYGNGTYGANWEKDLHTHSPATYASNVVAYSQAMKAVDPTIKVGAVLTAPNNWPDGLTNAASPQPWNTTVLSTACSSLDFVIAHWYPQNPGNESDANLLSSSSQVSGMVSTLRSEIKQYCGSRADEIKIMITETNSVSSKPGKQTVGIVDALFLADDVMSWLENGVANVDWWTLHNSPVSGSNNSASLNGTAQFGDYGVLSRGICTTTTPIICEPAANTPFPSYYALQMLSKLGKKGDKLVSSSSNQNLIALHAVKQKNGDLAVLIINKDPVTPYKVSLSLNGYTHSPNATVSFYGEKSKMISSTQQTGLTTPITEQLLPYSLTVILLHPDTAPTSDTVS